MMIMASIRGTFIFFNFLGSCIFIPFWKKIILASPSKWVAKRNRAHIRKRNFQSITETSKKRNAVSTFTNRNSYIIRSVEISHCRWPEVTSEDHFNYRRTCTPDPKYRYRKETVSFCRVVYKMEVWRSTKSATIFTFCDIKKLTLASYEHETGIDYKRRILFHNLQEHKQFVCLLLCVYTLTTDRPICHRSMISIILDSSAA